LWREEIPQPYEAGWTTEPALWRLRDDTNGLSDGKGENKDKNKA
jgi:hypothetical protein